MTDETSDDTSDETSDDTYDRKFRVTSVEKSDPPKGISGDDWYHYVISQGPSKIMGQRPGTLKSVTEHAEEFVENLNRRAALGYSAYAARKPDK
jgi:hypothetical protein